MKNNFRSILAIAVAAILLYLFFSKNRDTPQAITEETAESEASSAMKLANEKSESQNSQKILTDQQNSLPTQNTEELATSRLSAEKIQQVRSNMKVSLAAIYAAQKAYQAEYDSYTYDLNAIGFRLDGGPQDYKVGFPDSNSDMILENRKYSELSKNINFQDLIRHCQYGCKSNKDQFEAIAASNLDDDEDLDIWVINDKKEMTHILDDLK